MSPTTLSKTDRTSSGQASALSQTFAACAAENRSALVLYTTSGHPRREQTLTVLQTLAGAGADIIELGVPFSDPLADGPTIQRSSYEAIQQGTDLPWTLEILAQFRARWDTPVVLFSYLNPIFGYGIDRFLADATDAGAQGVLVTDLPTGSDPALEEAFARSSLDLIRLIAPTTPPERVREIANDARGFLYYISRTGVTGAQEVLAEGLAEEVSRVRGLLSIPLAVGFGISTPEQAGAVAQVADGVVVGSALVKKLATEGIPATGRFVRELRGAMQRSGE